MSDFTAGGHGGHAPGPAARTPRAEFYAYFALIFAVAVPVALVLWVIAVITTRRLPVHGPLARAWREAGAITPAIFRP
jgi:PufQ cytochrome subunit